MPAQEDFKQQVREILDEFSSNAPGLAIDLVRELWIATDQEEPCNRPASISFIGSLVAPTIFIMVAERYEECDGNLMLPAEIEQIAMDALDTKPESDYRYG